MPNPRYAYPRIAQLIPAVGWYVVYDGIEPNTPLALWALIEDKDGRYDRIETRVEGIDPFEDMAWCSQSPTFRGYTTDAYDSHHARVRKYREVNNTKKETKPDA